MPVKVILIGGFFVVATGIIVYENREHIADFFDTARRKIATGLHSLADEIAGKQREAPMAMGGSFGAGPVSEKHSAQFQQPLGEASGSGSGFDRGSGGLRQRGVGIGGPLLSFDDVDAENEKLLAASDVASTPSSRRSSSATLYGEKPLPPPPAPAPAPEESPIESGYESLEAHAAVLHQPPPPLPAPASESTHTLAGSDDAMRNPFEDQAPTPFWDVNDWAEAAETASSGPSLAGSAAEDLEAALEEDELASLSGHSDGTVDSWSEVGSEVSGEH